MLTEMGKGEGQWTFADLLLSLGAGFVWGRQTEPLTTLSRYHTHRELGF